jgi:hypothetical protein
LRARAYHLDMSRGARFLIVLALAGCAPNAVWHPARRELCRGKLCYRVGPLDATWRLVHREGAAIGFYSDTVGGVIQANATCRDDAEAAGLDTLTRHLLIGYTDRKILEQREVTIAQRDALHTRVEAKLDGVPIVLELYVLKRNGCIFDLSYAAPPAKAAAGAPAFWQFVIGFWDERPA